MNIKDLLKPKSDQEIRQVLDSFTITERLELIKKLESDIATYEVRLGAYGQAMNWENRNLTELIEELGLLIKHIENSFK